MIPSVFRRRRRPGAEENPSHVENTHIDVAAVIGCGFLGAKIALELASIGLQVNVFDRGIRPRDIQATIAQFQQEYLHALSSTQLDSGAQQQHFHDALSRIRGCGTIEEAVRDAIFVSEAVVENLSVKVSVVEQIEAACSPACFITTNSLTIPIGEIQNHARHQQRIMGVRFLFPALFIPYVELSHRPDFQSEQADDLRSLLESWGKTCFEALIPSQTSTLQDALAELHYGYEHQLKLTPSEAMNHQRHEARVRTSTNVQSFSAEQTCVVCLDQPSEVLLVGCGHRVLCTECARVLSESTRGANCPVCRMQIHGQLGLVRRR